MEVDNSRARSAHPAQGTPRSNVVKVLHWGDNPPLVVCLCGPDRFKSEMLTAFRAFTLLGHVVMMPGLFDASNGGFLTEETRKKLNELHLKKIQMSDLVYVVNPKGHLSTTTKNEIAYAESLGKEIRYLDS